MKRQQIIIMFVVLTSLSIIALLFYRDSIKTGDCHCPYTLHVGLDSTTIDLTHKDDNWGFRLGLGDTIRQWTVASGKIHYNGPQQERKERKVLVRRFRDLAPEMTYRLRYYETFFCAYHDLICRSALSEEEKLQLILDEFERFRMVFQEWEEEDNIEDIPAKPLFQPAKPKMGAVTIITEPTNAQILIDGEIVGWGTTPLLLPVGPNQLLVKAPGYLPQKHTVYVQRASHEAQIYPAVLTQLDL